MGLQVWLRAPQTVQKRTSGRHRHQASSAVVLHVTRLAAYRERPIPSRSDVLEAIGLGPTLIPGSYLGTCLPDCLPASVYVMQIAAVLLVLSIGLLIRE